MVSITFPPPSEDGREGGRKEGREDKSNEWREGVMFTRPPRSLRARGSRPREREERWV